MSPQYALFYGDTAAHEVLVEADSLREAIQFAEQDTGYIVVMGQRVS